MTTDNQVRVILWSVPRSGSTAFEKCMSNIDDVQIINEPYVSVYYYGPDRKQNAEYETFFDVTTTAQIQEEHDMFWNSETATYKFIKENIMEAEYPGKKVVFAKDMSYGIMDRIDMLPKGYRHAFLIRNPVRTTVSSKTLFNKFPKKDGEVKIEDSYYVPKYYAFGESVQLYEYLVTTGIEPDPVIIDSDDLNENPKSILQQFCGRTGIPYTDKLLNWDAGDDVVQKWKASNIYLKANKIFKFYDNAFESTSFHKPKPVPKRSELDDDVNKAIDVALPYYEKLYELRIKP